MEYVFASPVGNLKIITNGKEIISLNITKEIISHDVVYEKLVQNAINQLDEYFKGKRKVFSLPLSLKGTEFQKRVWRELIKIPYGQVISYSELAQKIGNKNAARAAGNANNKNPLLIIIPCHRVIGKNGDLTGYKAGVKIKQKLLEIEKTKL